jgi:hypothetical protein
MEVKLFESYNTTKRSRRKRHLLLLLLAVVVNWAIWFLVSIPSYRQMAPDEARADFWTDLWQTAVETTLLFELAVLYSRVIIRVLWHSPHTFEMLVFQCIILLVLNFLSAALVGWIYSLIYPDMNATGLRIRVMFSDGVTVYFVTSIFFMSYLFNQYWIEAEKVLCAEKDKLYSETVLLRTKLDKLALQTNNHFVFNGFSTLGSLIKDCPDDAEIFLQGLSNMYRYLVVKADTHIVPLSEELAFTNEYICLVKYRYTGVAILMDSSLSTVEGFVVPVSIQQLVENAIVHNRHGKDDTLSICLRFVDGMVEVSNNVLPRIDDYQSSGTGLKTLQERYRLLSGKEVQVQSDDSLFTVRIPVLFLEDLKDESIDY